LDADIQDRIMTMKETKGDAEIFQKQTCKGEGKNANLL
jgi:hypothetical protein